MRKIDEIIFNLFLIEFWMDYFPTSRFEVDEYGYHHALQSHTFQMLKDCFPENEYCSISQRNVNYIECFYPTVGNIFKE